MNAKPRRPVLVLLLAVAQILVGGGLLCTGGCGIGNSFLGASGTVTVNRGGKSDTFVYDTRKEMEKEAPGYTAFIAASGVAGLLLALAAIVGAVGLLKQWAWGWWLSLAWAVLEIGFQWGVAAYLWTVAMPATRAVARASPHDTAGVSNGLVNTNTFFHFGWAIFASGFWLYPALVLLLLVLPPVRRSSRPVESRRVEEDEEDYHTRRRWEAEEREEEAERRRRRRRRRDEDDED
jgi:hypothetical protein